MDIRRFGRRDEKERYRSCRERERESREIVRTDTNRNKLLKINRAGGDWLCGKIYDILMI